MTEGQEELDEVSESQIAVHWREEGYFYPYYQVHRPGQCC